MGRRTQYLVPKRGRNGRGSCGLVQFQHRRTRVELAGTSLQGTGQPIGLWLALMKAGWLPTLTSGVMACHLAPMRDDNGLTGALHARTARPKKLKTNGERNSSRWPNRSGCTEPSTQI